MLRKPYYIVREAIRTYPILCLLTALQVNLLLMSEYQFWRARHLLDQTQATLRRSAAACSTLETRLVEYTGRR
jgi:hypothetical protein